MDVVGQRPAGAAVAGEASWERWCTAGQAREDRRRLAFCARVDGLVLSCTHGPGPGEAHVRQTLLL